MTIICLKLVTISLIFAKNEITSRKIGEVNDFITNCRENIRLIGLDKDDLFDFVTVKLNSKLVLWCHYCKQDVTYTPKIWYKQSRLTDEPPKEVDLGMDSKLSDNRVYSKPDHTLIITAITEDDAALYFCYGPKREEEENRYNYMVDVVPENIPLRTGSTESWKNYTQNGLKVINDKFKNSLDGEYLEIREIGIKIHTIFETTRWGLCNGCSKIRKRFSECRMKTQPLLKAEQSKNSTGSTNLMNTTEDVKKNKKKQRLNSFELSCHSLLFAKLYPNISSELMHVENFVFTEPCYAPCQIIGPSTAPKYRNTIVLYEGDHITLICPEATIENDVVWTKDGITVLSNVIQENVRVDSLNTLYISHATMEEDGNYTCFVDEEKMQEVIVAVHVRSVINSKAFLRHIQYLGFIFIFSVIFYIAGLIITCARRDTFKKIDFNALNIIETRWDKAISDELF